MNTLNRKINRMWLKEKTPKTTGAIKNQGRKENGIFKRIGYEAGNCFGENKTKITLFYSSPNLGFFFFVCLFVCFLSFFPLRSSITTCSYTNCFDCLSIRMLVLEFLSWRSG